MGDALVSPTDPIFHFFHADLDRLWQLFQLKHMDLGIYHTYPEQQPCGGHGLHDQILGAIGPTPRQLGLGLENTPITVAQLIERTLPPEFGTEIISPYTYVPATFWEGNGLNPTTYPSSTVDGFCANLPPPDNQTDDDDDDDFFSGSFTPTMLVGIFVLQLRTLL